MRIEAGLRAAPAYARAEIVDAGLPSETVSGLSEPGHAGGKFPRPDLHERLDRVLAGFKPTLVLSCYGMNDGIYQPLSEERQAAFARGYTRLHQAVLAAGAEHIAVTAPLFDGDHPPGKNRYDEVLDAQAAWLLKQGAAGWKVVDIRPDLRRQVAAAKQADPAFIFAKDRIHPGEEGHRFIAIALWPGLAGMLGLPSDPALVSANPAQALAKRQELLKHAWLSETRHLRPGIHPGKPLAQAQAEAGPLLEAYLSSR